MADHTRNPYFPRALEDRVLRASRQFPAILVTGPRQVGKTTLLRHVCEPTRRYVSLDDLAVRSQARRDPALFVKENPPPLLLDEVQYAPELLSYLKMEIDQRGQPGLYWLTGSQQFHMMRDVTESLAGRIAVIQMLGFSLREADRRRVTLDPFLPLPDRIAPRAEDAGPTDPAAVYSAIWRGSLPRLVAGPVEDRNLFLNSYTQSYLQRDVRDLAQIGNQEAFLRFLRACAARTAQILNIADLARDVDISVGTARSWLSILEASLQILLLRPYHTNVSKRLIKRPKMYFLDTGLCSYLTEWLSPETLASGAMAGAILETHVVIEILKSWWHRIEFPNLYYYRDKDGREIDLLFVREGKFHPVEIKKSATPHLDWTRSMEALDRLPAERGAGAVICLIPKLFALDDRTAAVPVGMI